MPDNKQKLFESLKSKGLYTKSFDDFNSQFSDSEKVDKLYQKLSSKGLYTRSGSEFTDQFFPDLKKKGSSEGSDNGEEISGTPASISQDNSTENIPRQVNIRPDNFGLNTTNPTAIGSSLTSSGDNPFDINPKAKPVTPGLESAMSAYAGAQGRENANKINQLSANKPQEQVSIDNENVGSRSGYVGNKLLQGIGSIASGLIDLGLNAGKTLPVGIAGGIANDAVIGEYRKNIAPKVRDYLKEKVGFEVDKGAEKTYDNEFITSSIGGLAQSAPAMLSGYTGLLLQGYDSGIQSINNSDPNGLLDEETKTIYGSGLGLVQSALEKVGLDKIMKGNTTILSRILFDKAVREAAEKSSGKVTGDLLEQYINNNIKGITGLFAKGGAKAVEGFLAEFGTGASQETAAIGSEFLLNEATGKPIFDTSKEETWDGFIKRVAYAGAQEGVGGFIMGPFFNNSRKSKVNEVQNKIQAISNQLDNPNLSLPAAEALTRRKIELQGEIDQEAEQESNEQKNLNPEALNRAAEIDEELNKLYDAINDPELSEELKPEIQSQIDSMNLELDQLVSGSKNDFQFKKNDLVNYTDEDGNVIQVPVESVSGDKVKVGINKDGIYTSVEVPASQISTLNAPIVQNSVNDGSKPTEITEEETKGSVDFFKINEQDKFYHASGKKRVGRLKEGSAPQFGKGIYFSTNKDLVIDEFGNEVTEVQLKAKKPLFTNTKEENEVKDLAAKKWNDENLTYDSENEQFVNKEGQETTPVEAGDLGERLPISYYSTAAKELGYDVIIDKDSSTYDNEIVVIDESIINYPEETPNTQVDAIKEVIEKQSKSVEDILGISKQDADVIALIYNADLSPDEKNILMRQYKRGVMSVRDIKNMTVVNIEKINNGDIDKWANVILSKNKKNKKFDAEDIYFDEIIDETQKTEQTTLDQSNETPVLNGDIAQVVRPEDSKSSNKPKQVKEETIGNPDYKSKPQSVGRSTYIRTPDGDKIEGTYKVVSADDVLASHNEITFSQTENFPTTESGTTVNDRDYSKDRNAQGQVIEIASNFDSRAINDTPIVDSNGIVISGNNRTMSRKLASTNKTDATYLEELSDKADMFGVDPESIKGIKNPMLVFEPKTNMPYTTETFAKFNKATGKEKGPIEKAVEIAKTITDKARRQIASIYENATKASDITSDSKNAKELKDVLIGNKIIDQKELPRYFDVNKNVFTKEGVAFLENLLMGGALNEASLRALDAESMGDVRKKIIGSVVQLTRNSALGENSLADNISNAIEISNKLKKSGLSLQEYVAQGNIFDDSVMSDTDFMVASALEDSNFKGFLQNYNDNVGSMDLWTGKERDKKAVTNDFIDNKYGKSADQIRKNLTSDDSKNKGEVKKDSGNVQQKTSGSSEGKAKEEVAVKIIDQLSENNSLIKSSKIEGKLFSEQEAIDYQKEIEANYTPEGQPRFGQDNTDIRTFMFNYDNPIAEKDVNGVNLRIAEGLVEGEKYSGERRKTYLLYANGKVAGKFYSVKDIKKVIGFIEDNLVNKIGSEDIKQSNSIEPSNPVENPAEKTPYKEQISKLNDLIKAQESKIKQAISNMAGVSDRSKVAKVMDPLNAEYNRLKQIKKDLEKTLENGGNQSPDQDAKILMNAINPLTDLMGIVNRAQEKFISSNIRKVEDIVAGAFNTWLESKNYFKRNAAQIATAIFNGIPRSQKILTGKLQMTGGMNKARHDAKKLLDQLYNLVGSDLDKLEQVHQMLDPDLYASLGKPPLGVVSRDVQLLHDELRGLLDDVHRRNFALGFIDQETYDKYKGTYTPRMYETNEIPDDVQQLLDDQEKFNPITQMETGQFKKRKDLEDLSQKAKDDVLKDPVYSTVKRLMQLDQNAAIANYINQIITNSPNLVKDPASGVIPKGYQQLNGKGYGKLNGKYVPNYIAEDFKGFFMLNGLLNKGYDFIKGYDKLAFRQFLKKSYTVFNPVVQLGNFISNFTFAFASGIDPVTFATNIPKAYKALKSEGSEFQTLLRAGILQSDTVVHDLIPIKAKNGILPKDQNIFMKAVRKVDEKATEAYQMSDDLAKMNAYITFKEQGFTQAQAIQKVYEGFQNYATVGKMWDAASKVPFVGPAFIKFQADLLRIIKNGVTKTPLTTAMYLASLNAVPQMLQMAGLADGEDEDEEALRTGRDFIPKVPLGFTDIPLVYKTNFGEVNLARYLSPFYMFDTGDASSTMNVVKKLLPVGFINKQEAGKGNETTAPALADPLAGTLYEAIFGDTDFRGKSIKDPESTRYRGSGSTVEEEITNKATFLARSWIPQGANMHDFYLSQKYGEDFYGRTRNTSQSLLNMIVKVQDWQEGDYKKTAVKKVDVELSRIKSLSDERKNIIANFGDKVKNANQDYYENRITKDQYERRVSEFRSKAIKRIQENGESIENVYNELNEFVNKNSKFLK